MQKDLARVARQGRTAEIVEAMRSDAQLAPLLALPGVNGDLSRLTGQELITRLGKNDVASSEVVAQLKQAMGMLQREAGDLSGRVLQVEGIEEFFKGALTSANPHTVDFELHGIIEQMRMHPESHFRFQMPLGGLAGPDLVRYGDRAATVVQFKSFRRPFDAVKDIEEQVESDLRRLHEQNFMLPGSGGVGRVPVDRTMVYEIDFSRLKTSRPELDLHTFEVEMQERLNDYLSALASQDASFSVGGKPFRLEVHVR